VTGDWVEICKYDAIYPDTGVCALIDGRQVAIFRLSDGKLYAVSNYDPFSQANVLSRGIVGDRGGEPKIASPIYKQTFNLRTGVCYEDTGVRLDVYRVRRHRGVVEVFSTPVEATGPELDDETLDGLGYTKAS
jgi:nitrite reductase (NADH) small subunit